MGDQWPEFPLARAVRRPVGAHRDGQPRLCAEPGRARGRNAGARHGARRRHREDGVGVQVQRVSERRPTAPRRLGVAGGRSGHRQYLRARRLRARRRPEQGRQAALGAFGRRRVRRVHDARRPHDVADRRRRSRHRERRHLELGHAGQSRAPVSRPRQEDRRHRLGVHAGRASVRHGVRAAHDCDDQRPAPAHRRHGRRRRSRDEATDR